MNDETAQRLAEAFPHTFKVTEGKHPLYPGKWRVLRAHIPDKMEGWEIVYDIGNPAWRDDALLHGVLRDLCERAGLRLLEQKTGLWGVYRLPEDDAFNTPTEAVLAAADEINRTIKG